jgi:hypothetical protein
MEERKKVTETSVGILDVLAEIGTGHLLNRGEPMLV